MVNHSVRFYLIPPKVIANIFGNWLNGVDPRFKVLIRVGANAVIWALWICKMTRFLTIKFLLLCRSSTDVRLCSVYDLRWRTENSLRRCLHG
jgi:hypothetical protein